MYDAHFGLNEKPFSLATDPRYLYMSPQHWEAMAHLMYGVDDDWGFVMITGEIGTGKTTLCRLLLEQLPEDVAVAFILHPKITVSELLLTVCEEFGVMTGRSMTGEKELVDLLHRHLLETHAKGQKALLIIDEAQYLSAGVLDQLRLLTNLETNEGKLLRIILIGQPELRDTIGRPDLVQMSQRITARYHLGRLSKEETEAFVRHRLTVAGGRPDLFTRAALSTLHRLTGGVPRLINVICDRALVGASLRREHSVSRSLLRQAAGEVSGRQSLLPAFIRSRAAAFFLGLTIIILILAAEEAFFPGHSLPSLLMPGARTAGSVSAEGTAQVIIPPAPGGN